MTIILIKNIFKKCIKQKVQNKLKYINGERKKIYFISFLESKSFQTEI
jgi:hypothetical protein